MEFELNHNDTPTQKQKSANKFIRNIRDLKLAGRTVFMRLDLNVPLGAPNADGVCEILDETRVTESLPTIKYAVENGAKVVIASHLGRPKGQRKKEFSLEPVAKLLAQYLNEEVTLADDCVGEGIEMMVQSLQPGQILLLENLRFHIGEEKNDPGFCEKLARLGQIYINDAFGTAHRRHASNYGLPQIMDIKASGFLIDEELLYMDKLINGPEQPFHLLLGGAKVSDKIRSIEALMRNVDTLLVGGAMAFAFLKAQGKPVPPEGKQPSPEDVQAAGSILRSAEKFEIPVILPEDLVDAFDIGPKTIRKFIDILYHARTVFWNGPLGWFEKPEYAQGTNEVAKALANTQAVKIVGGGDTISAINSSGAAKGYDHLSTGGGAALKYLEGEGLPGIDVLKTNPNRVDSPTLG